jgi:hypothetical protein
MDVTIVDDLLAVGDPGQADIPPVGFMAGVLDDVIDELALDIGGDGLNALALLGNFLEFAFHEFRAAGRQ